MWCQCIQLHLVIRSVHQTLTTLIPVSVIGMAHSTSLCLDGIHPTQLLQLLQMSCRAKQACTTAICLCGLCCFFLDPDTLRQQLLPDRDAPLILEACTVLALLRDTCQAMQQKEKHESVAKLLLATEAQEGLGLSSSLHKQPSGHLTWKICLSRGCRCRCQELRMKSSSKAMTGARMTTPSQKAGVLKRCGPNSTMSVSVRCSGSIELKPQSAGSQQPMLRPIITALIHVK